MLLDRRNLNILPRCPGGHAIQQDSIHRIGMRYNKKKTNGKYWINDKGFPRWCFVVDVWNYIFMLPDVYQDPVYNTKEVDVAYVNLV